jgi:N-acetylglutamate synthase-like GNAT family acetyltransferase
MIIRKAQIIDTPDIYRLLYNEWGTDVADRIFAEVNTTFDNSSWKPEYYVAVDKMKFVIGFAGFIQSHILHGVYELNGCVVDKEERNKGIARLLTEKRLEEIKKLGGTFVMLMTKENELFQKRGFLPVGFHGDWILMTKELAAPNFENV